MSATAQNEYEQKSIKSEQLSETESRDFATDVTDVVPGISGSVPLTFDPTNTEDCPSMFAEKWQAQ